MKVKVARALKKYFRRVIDQRYQRKSSPPEPVDGIDARLASLPERKENDRDLNMRRRRPFIAFQIKPSESEHLTVLNS